MQIKQESKQLFKNGYDTITRFDALSKVGLLHHSEAKNFYKGDYKILRNTENNTYLISGSNMIDSQAIRFDKSVELSSNFFHNLLIIESIRGITSSMREILYHKNADAKEIRELFIEYIFDNDSEKFQNFYDVILFIRNTFSHNIRDRLEIKLEDYKGQRNKPQINFSFDISHFKTKRDNKFVEINIEFDKIKDGMLYTNIIEMSKTISFIEFCYNCVNYLKDHMDIPPSYKILDSNLGSY